MNDALAQTRTVWGSGYWSVCGTGPAPGPLDAHVWAPPVPLAAANGVSSLGCSGGVFVILSDIVKRWVRVTKDAGRVSSTCCKKCDWPVAGVVQFSKDPELGALPISPLAHASDARGFRRIRLKLDESAGHAALVNGRQARPAANRTDACGAVPGAIRRLMSAPGRPAKDPGAKRPIADRRRPAPEGVDRRPSVPIPVGPVLGARGGIGAPTIVTTGPARAADRPMSASFRGLVKGSSA